MAKFVSADILDSVVRAYVREDGEKSVSVILRDILVSALPKYFDRFGNFSGLKIHFDVPLYMSDGKQRVDSFTRHTMSIDDKTWGLLVRAQTYTTMSRKNIAEVVILKELLEKREGGENGYAEDRAVHQRKSHATDD